MKRIAEPIKTIILIVLTVSMVWMAGRLMIADLFTSGTGSVEKTPATFFTGLGLPFMSKYFEEDDRSAENEFSEGALIYPYLIAVNREGVTIGTVGDEQGILAAYSAIEGVLGESLGGEIRVSETPFETLCTGEGVFVDMGRYFPLDLMCRIASGRSVAQGGIVFDRMFIFNSQDGVRTAFTDGRETYITDACSQTLDLTQTATGSMLMESAESLSGLLKNVRVRGTSLLSADGLTAQGLVRSNTLYSESAQNYSYANLSAILSVFSINSGSLNNEIKDDGSVIYVENLRSIRAGTDGSVSFSAYQDNGGVMLSDYIGEAPENGYNRQQVLTAAQKFLAVFDRQILGGEASIRLKNAYYDAAQGGYIVEFEYCMNGMELGSGSEAAKLVYRNGNFVNAEMNFVHYLYSGDSVTLDSLDSLFRLFAGRGGTLGKIRTGYFADGGRLNAQYMFYWED